ncbi:MAG: hypothetical protein HY051_04885 [Candidatus Aenigmarchaeota archaeon]|nr:hypothetical protein [Candidatus Aenigmarchaeota archaeon]
MEEGKTKAKNLILDANIVISCLAKEFGITRACMIILKIQNARFYTPKSVHQEILFHIPTIARRYKIDANLLKISLQELFRNVGIEDEINFKDYIDKAKALVNDEKDATLAALALKQKPATIITFNKKHFNKEKLEKLGIDVLEPHETLFLKFGIDIRSVNSKVKRKGVAILLQSIMELFEKKVILLSDAK